jgi:hypothetical protein
MGQLLHERGAQRICSLNFLKDPSQVPGIKLESSIAVRVVADPKEGKLLVLPEIQKGRKKGD